MHATRPAKTKIATEVAPACARPRSAYPKALITMRIEEHSFTLHQHHDGGLLWWWLAPDGESIAIDAPRLREVLDRTFNLLH